MNETRVEVATGGHPGAALVSAAGPIPPGGAYTVTVAHDPGCPCLTPGHPMQDCTCELVVVTTRRIL